MKRWQRIIGATLMVTFFGWFQHHPWFEGDPGATWGEVLILAPFTSIIALRLMKLLSDDMNRWL